MLSMCTQKAELLAQKSQPGPHPTIINTTLSLHPAEQGRFMDAHKGQAAKATASQSSEPRYERRVKAVKEKLKREMGEVINSLENDVISLLHLRMFGMAGKGECPTTGCH